MSDIEWREPQEGFLIQPDEVVVSEQNQVSKLSACGLSPDLFGGFVDPSFYIGLGIQAGIRSGISAEGNVNMLTTLIQHRPVHLGEPLIVRGEIRKLTPVPRGTTVDTDVWFEDSSPSRAITASRLSLKPGSQAQQRGAGSRPVPVIDTVDDLKLYSSHTLTPDLVKNYSSEGNSIHYDMQAANEAGFRAPIIGGGMGVHFLMACLWQEQQPVSVGLEIYFRRPIFWDDTFEVGVLLDQQGAWQACALVKAGKVLTEARVVELS